jgi:hypothetical protein
MGSIVGVGTSAMDESEARALVNVNNIFDGTIFQGVWEDFDYESEDDAMIQFGVGGPA